MATISESQWVNHFGFQRFPFDRPEAGNEEFSRPAFLASCFIEPRGYERAFTPVTSLMFAARGTGKTACRVMMDYDCKTGGSRLGLLKDAELNYVLSVPHIKLDNVRDVARQLNTKITPPEITVEHHVIEIMRQAIPAFVELIAGNDGFVDKVRDLYSIAFEDLSSYINLYSLYLTSQQKEYLRNKLGINVSYSSKRVDILTLMHLENLENWAKLMQMIGIKATYTMVDGVDELMESAEDPNYAYYIIRPLLTHLRLMDGTPYLAFKFFLPSSMEQVVLSDPAFRRDRGFIIQNIEWQEEDLINILHRRLIALSKDRIPAGFGALCIPELRGEIENNLARSANGNPRYLMNLCAQMVTKHCSREILSQTDEYELNGDDYLYAIEYVKSIYKRIVTTQKFQDGEVVHGRYRVEKVIRTSHSQITKAWDEGLKRFVAIKSPHIEQFSLDEGLVKRFHENLRREAELLAKLHHRYIGQVFDILEEPFGVIMEWVDGRSVHEILDKKEQLSVHDILMIGVGIVDALTYAHHKGVIHRDINPKNIILTLDKIPKLIDFDTARDDILETITMREDGSRFLVGTPRYSSPEQLVHPNDMSLSEIGPASDIFSLGVVIYEMLTFEKPYEYGNRLAQYGDDFPKPKPYKIPKPLYRILLSMLDGKVSKRPTAEVLKRKLQRLLETHKPPRGDI